MVAIVSGNSTGLTQTSSSTIGQRGTLGQASSGASGEQVHVNIATGNLVLQDRDAFIEGRGLDIALLRTYNSQGTLTDDNADAWWLNGYRQMTNLTGTANTVGSSIQRVAEDNAVLTYNYDVVSQQYLARNNAGQLISAKFDAGSNTWSWRDASLQITEVYEAHGDKWRLTSMRDANGQALIYAYSDNLLSSITDANGEALEFIYTGNDLTQERTRQADGSYISSTHYTYDAQHRLSQVVTDLSPNDNSIADGKVYTTTYTYVDSSNLVSRVQQRDGTQINLTYIKVDGIDRVDTLTDALGRATRFAYNTASKTTTVTDAYGNQNVYVYDEQNRFVSITGPATDGATNYTNTAAPITGNNSVRQKIQYTYNATGQIQTAINAEGTISTYNYDTNGQLVLITDSVGNRTEYTYNANRDLLTSTVYRQPAQNGQPASQPATTRHIYDANHRERFAISAEGNVQEAVYNGFGQKIRSISYTAGRFNVQGLTVNQLPTLAEMSNWSAMQDKTRSQVTAYDYNARGQLKSVTAFTTVASDGQGIYDGTQSTTSYTYDVQGNVLQKIDPAHQQSSMVYGSFTYDGLNRLLSSTDALGQAEIYTYDDAQRTSTIQLRNGRVDTKVYDAAGQLLSTLTGGIAKTEYRYDPLGRLGLTVDPTGLRHFYAYDAAGNLRVEVAENGRVTSYSYNAMGQKIVTRTYEYEVNATRFNTLTEQYYAGTIGLNDLKGLQFISLTSKDSVAAEVYDSNGRLADVIESLSDGYSTSVKEFKYDAVGNLVSTIQRAQLRNGYRYGSFEANTIRASDIRFDTDSMDRQSFNYYDLDNRLIGLVDAGGYVTQYRYDAAGHQIEVIRYAKAVVGAQIGSQFSQLITGLSHIDDQHTYSLYDAQGRQTASVDAEGYLTEFTYDSNGRLLNSKRYGEVVNQAVTDTARVDDLRPLSGEIQTSATAYDDLGRIARKTNSEGTVTTYCYNELGQLTDTVSAAGTLDLRAETQKYDQFGRVIASLSGMGSVALLTASTPADIAAVWAQYATINTYDLAGRRTSTTDASGNRTVFYYDKVGNVTLKINALGEVQYKLYDVRTNQVKESYQIDKRISNATIFTGGLVSDEVMAEVYGIMNWQKDSLTFYIFKSGSNNLEIENIANGDWKYSQIGYEWNTFGESSKIREATSLNTSSNVVTKLYNKRGLVSDVIADANGIKQLTHFDYDAFGRVITKVDPNGNRTEYKYDKLGHVIELVDPAVNKTLATKKTTFDAFGRVLTQTDLSDNTTTYVYDKNERSVTITSPEGISVKTIHNRHGQTQTVIDSNQVATVYTYDKNGNLFTVVSNGVKRETIYDKRNLLAHTVDANGSIVDLDYDAVGRLLTRTVHLEDGTTLVTTYEYDGKGQQVLVTDPNGVSTEFVYDLKGQLKTQIVDSKAGGLRLITQFEYDLRGKTVKVTDPKGIVTEYVYDIAGRREKEIVDATGARSTTIYKYDQNNNVISRTDANNFVTRYAYDANNRQIAMIDAAGAVTTMEYDRDGRVIKQTRFSTVVPADQLAGLGLTPTAANVLAKVPSLVEGKDQVESRFYDKDGRLIWSIDGAGRMTTFAYDKNGNVAERISYAKTLTDSTLVNKVKNHTATLQELANAAALLRDMQHDTYVSQSYDKQNRLEWQANGVGAVTRFVYDNNGNRIKQIQYAKPIPTTTLAKDISSMVVQDTADCVINYIYDSANRLVYEVNSAGQVTQNIFDKNGNVVERVEFAQLVALPSVGTLLSINNLSQGSNSFSQTVARQENFDRVTRNGFDAANRLVLSIDPENAVTEYTYNQVGEPLTVRQYKVKANTDGLAADAPLKTLRERVVTSSEDRITQYVYDVVNRRQYVIAANGSVTMKEYDGLGHLAKSYQYESLVSPTGNVPLSTLSALDATANIRKTTYVYTASGQLKETRDVDNKLESYDYNGLGQKTSFTNKNNATWTYEYDTAGRLAREIAPEVDVVSVKTDGTGAVSYHQTVKAKLVTEFIYDGLGNLTARIEAKGLPEERRTTYEYDALGRQVKVLYPVVAVYDAAIDSLINSANIGRAEVPKQLYSQTFYDSLGNAIANRDVGGNYSYKTYDKLGRVMNEIDANGYVTSYERDEFGQVKKTTRYGNDNPLSQAIKESLNAAPLSTDLDGQRYVQIANLYKLLFNIAPPDAGGMVTWINYSKSHTLASTAGEIYISGGLSTKSASEVIHDIYTKVLGFSNPDHEAIWAQRLSSASTTEAKGAVFLSMIKTITVDNNDINTHRFISSVSAGLIQLALSESVNGNHSKDRVLETKYDRLGRVIESKEPTTFVYDVATQGKAAAKVTVNQFNSFGDVERVKVYQDSNGGLTRELVSETRNYFDARGLQIASVDAMGYLTTQEYDALGNITRKVEYSEALTATERQNEVKQRASIGAKDRATSYVYDLFNRLKEEVKHGVTYKAFDDGGQPITGTDLRTVYEYDALGNRTTVEDAAKGKTRSLYDALGRVTATMTPGSGANNDQHLLTQYRRDAYGNVVAKIDINFVGEDINNQPAVHYINEQNHRITYTAYDINGRATQTTNANNFSSYVSYDAFGHAVKNWQSVTGIDRPNLTSYLVTKFDGMGQVISTIQPGSTNLISGTAAAPVITTMQINAFGEVEKILNNGLEIQYADYDNAGHVWRTNAGDGVNKILLNDIEGRATAQIISAGTKNLRTDVPTASIAAMSADTITYKTEYDLLGHVIKRTAPSQGALLKVVHSGSLFGLSYQENTDDRFTPLTKFPDVFPRSGTLNKSADVTLPDTALWGNGDIKVEVTFKSSSVLSANSSIYKTDRIVNASAANSTIRVSKEITNVLESDRFAVSHIAVYKKNIEGNWISLADVDADALTSTDGQSHAIQSGSVLTIQAPDDIEIVPQLRYRVAGTAIWKENVSLMNFGTSYIFNPKNVAVVDPTFVGPIQPIALADGDYEYEIRYFDKRSQTLINGVFGTGNVKVGNSNSRQQAAQLFVLLLNRAPTAQELKDASERINVVGLKKTAQEMLQKTMSAMSGEQVLRHIYKNALGVEIDQAGLQYWLTDWNRPGDALAQGGVIENIILGNTSNVANNPTSQASAKLFQNKVEIALQFSYNQRGTDIAAANSVIQLVTASDTTIALAAVIAATTRSDAQIRVQIARLYVLLQNRSPELDGLEHWVKDIIEKGQSIENVAANIFVQSPLASKTNSQIIDIIFTQVLGYPDASAGVTWLEQLNRLPANASPAQKSAVLLQLMDNIISDSDPDLGHRVAQQQFNNRVMVGLFYAQGLRGNDVDYTKVLNAKVTAANPYDALIELQNTASPLAQDRLALTKMYVMLMNRAPDEKGLLYWLGNRNAGVTYEDILNGMIVDLERSISPPESHEQFIRRLLADTLDIRNPTSAFVQEWVAKLSAAGQAGQAKNRGEVIYQLIQYVQSYTQSDEQLKSARDLFNLKLAAGFNYVSLHGNDVKGGAVAVVAAAAPDLAAMKATQTVAQAKINLAEAALKLESARLAEATTILAKAVAIHEANAADLALTKAQALAASNDVDQAQITFDAAKTAWDNAKKAMQAAQDALVVANELLLAAENGLAYAKAAVAVDANLLNVEAVASAERQLLAAQQSASRALVEHGRLVLLLNEAQVPLTLANNNLTTKSTAKTNADSALATAQSNSSVSLTNKQNAEAAYNTANTAYLDAVSKLEKINYSNASYLTQIYQLYVLISNRKNPDLAGVLHWLNDMVLNRQSIKQVANNMYMAEGLLYANPATVIENIYKFSWGRTDNDTRGMKHWSDKLQAADTASKGGVLVDLMYGLYNPLPNLAAAEQAYQATSSALETANRNYQNALNLVRDNGADVKNPAFSELSAAEAALSTVNSYDQENRKWLYLLYATLKATTPDAAGLTYWLNNLKDKNFTIADVAGAMRKDLHDGKSYMELINYIYHTAWGFTGDQTAGKNFWLGQFQTYGGTDRGRGEVIMAMISGLADGTSSDWEAVQIRTAFNSKITSSLNLELNTRNAAKLRYDAIVANYNKGMADKTRWASEIPSAEARYKDAENDVYLARLKPFVRQAQITFEDKYTQGMSSGISDASTTLSTAKTAADNAKQAKETSAINYKNALDAYTKAQSDATLAQRELLRADLEAARAKLERDTHQANVTQADLVVTQAMLDLKQRATTTAQALIASSNVQQGSALSIDFTNALIAYQKALAESEAATSAASRVQTNYELISSSSLAERTKIQEFYLLLEGRTEPDVAGFGYWLNELRTSGSELQVIKNMYLNPVTNIAALSSTQLINRIYEQALGRFDNDVAGMAYWIGHLDGASTSTAKAQVLLNLIGSIKSYSGPSSEGVQAGIRFTNRVNAGLSTLVSRASTALSNANGLKDTAVATYNSKKASYDSLRAALSTAQSLPPATMPSMTTKANNLSLVLRTFLLLSSASPNPSDMSKINEWVVALNQGTLNAANMAYKVYQYTNVPALSNAKLMERIYSVAMGRTQRDQAGEEYWTLDLNDANQRGDNAAFGQTFLNIIERNMSYASTDVNALKARQYFDQRLETLFTNYQVEEGKVKVSAQSEVEFADRILTSTKDAYEKAEAALTKAKSEAAVALKLGIAPEVSASPEQKQIAQLFALLFNRGLDRDGLDHWVGKLLAQGGTAQALTTIAQDIMSGAQGADAIVLSNNAFVEKLYRALGEDLTKLSVSTLDKITQHQTELASKSRAQIVVDILNETLRDQANDIAGLNRQQTLANRTAVSLIYAVQLNGNDPTVARTLFNNVTAHSIIGGINDALVAKPEAQTRTKLAALYMLLFGRTPDYDGFEHWYGEIAKVAVKNDSAWTTLARDMISGAKGLDQTSQLDDTSFIKKIYQNAFNVDPDASGLAYWKKDLETKSRAEVVNAILYSVQHEVRTDVSIKLNQKTFANKVADSLSSLLTLTQDKIRVLGNANTIDLQPLLAAMASSTLLSTQADAAARVAINAINQTIIGPEIKFNLNATYDWKTISSVDQKAKADIITYQESDRWGNVISVSDARNPAWKTEYSYNYNNQVTGTKNAKGYTTQNEYDQLGRLVATTDANGNVSKQRYDAAGHVIKSFQADAEPAKNGYGVTSYSLNAYGEVLIKTDGSGVTTVFTYDKMGNQKTSTTAAAAYFGINDLNYGRGTATLLGTTALTTTFIYDELGRRIRTEGPGNAIATTEYDLRGNVIRTVDVNGVTQTTAYDAQNRKVASFDGLNAMSWEYETQLGNVNFNRVASHVNMGGGITTYQYDQRGLLISEISTAQAGKLGKEISYHYNGVGQITHIEDKGTNTDTKYTYDEVGNRLHESIVQKRDGSEIVLQNNYLAYDELNRLRNVQDGRYFMQQDYDKNGNRVHIKTSYYGDGNVQLGEDRYNTYDQMNRQGIVDGNIGNAVLNKDGQIISGQLELGEGHQFTYDGAGRRTSDTSTAKKIFQGPYGVYLVSSNTDTSTEVYYYDGMGRLETTKRDGVLTDLRRYDSAGRLIQSGINGDLLGSDSYKKALAEVGLNNTVSLYNYKGGQNRIEVQQTQMGAAEGTYTGSEYFYDAAGNIETITRDKTSTIKYQYAHFDDYQVKEIINQRTKGGATVTTTNTFDANGHIIRVNDNSTGADNKSRTIYNDTQGNVLRKVEGSSVTTTLLVNGEVLGSTNNTKSSLDDLSTSYTSAKEISNAASSFKVPVAGMSLSAIAKQIWGDASQWYVIAEANGLAGDESLVEGTLLNIPAKNVGNHNNVGTNKPYSASSAIGDLTPTLPIPQGADKGCGPIGTIVTIVVAVVMTIFAPAGAGVWYSMATGALSSAVGQGAAVMAGEQDSINWKGIALSAVAGAVSYGVGYAANATGGALAGANSGAIAGRAMISNALTQGIAVKTGLTDTPFSWKGVAAAGAGAYVATELGGSLNKNGAFGSLGQTGGQFARGFVTAFAAGTTTAVMRGGKISVAQVAIDAFGNALGSSLARENVSGKSSNSNQDWRSAIENFDMDAHLRNSESFAAVQSPMDLMLNGPSILSDSDDPQRVVVSGRRFDPTKDSLMRDGSKGYAVTGKSWDDGSSVVTFANGIEYTDNNGNVAFDVRDTSKTILSGKDYEQSVARVQYLDQKYDPQNGWDQFKNYFTGKLDDSNYVLSDRDRVERETLHQINSISVDAAARPDTYDTRWASIDTTRSSVFGAVAEAANLKYVQPKYQQDVRQLVSGVNGLAITGSGLRQQYAFLGNVKAPGSPLLQPQNSSMVINQSQSIRTDRIVVGANNEVVGTANGPLRGPDGRFLARQETPSVFSRKTQYPSGYRSRVVDEVLDAHTIQSGPNAGKIRTADGDIVARNDPRITIEHQTPVVQHWNEVGFNVPRSVRNDFYNDTSNMSIRLKSANSADGGRMSSQGIRYRQDVGADHLQ